MTDITLVDSCLYSNWLFIDNSICVLLRSQPKILNKKLNRYTLCMEMRREKFPKCVNFSQFLFGLFLKISGLRPTKNKKFLKLLFFSLRASSFANLPYINETFLPSCSAFFSRPNSNKTKKGREKACILSKEICFFFLSLSLFLSLS